MKSINFLFIIVAFALYACNTTNTEKKSDNSGSYHFDGKTIGYWMDNTQLARTVVIYNHNDTWLLRSIYKDDSFGNDTVYFDGKNKYTRNEHEWYIIESNGNLGSYGANGKYYEFKKLM